MDADELRRLAKKTGFNVAGPEKDIPVRDRVVSDEILVYKRLVRRGRPAL